MDGDASTGEAACTVAEPVTNFLVFGYELIKGTSSDGSTKGDNNYPAPTLRVDPGERLIVHYDNEPGAARQPGVARLPLPDRGSAGARTTSVMVSMST